MIVEQRVFDKNTLRGYKKEIIRNNSLYPGLYICIAEDRSWIDVRGLSYDVTITRVGLFIGCKAYAHEEWKEFDDFAIFDMDGTKAIEFWKEYKELLLALCDIMADEKQDELARQLEQDNKILLNKLSNNA